MTRILCLILTGLCLLNLTTCRNKEKSRRPAAIRNADLNLPPVTGRLNPIRIEVLESWPHDPEAFTQGLIYENGLLYEGTGGNGQSSLREWELETGRIKRSIDLDPEYFGEGITRFNDKIYQLTWQSQTALVYDALSFQRIGKFRYPGQGWGLTHNDTCLIMSDGSDQIRFIDPRDFRLVRQISVTYQNEPVVNINELEWIKGEIWANIWTSNWIVRIN
ncbi:MAG: glutaminyl-peptide cyclotransferase, partial [Candidatus Delongbacteria bacterium]|nr:glutaminyl-peptide cyclotransferase [Candidatus Delongbacteria bacterium]